ncbi:GDSL-type esterase/lipase family protein [Brumimicrobium aurantiacum]|uniref:T9SS C-terminal target domain-containing protein n=1 Tax=Brumimicrobium aurantiacum TaxID=1737063 RepID=A0A3E1F1H1_9FLAO|nr:GDSL-type esterase/lipase family protein [Brumimicrobium aurantiacum]RFC55655.1 T9SS C-terminal target domain-containing protein [Brumimicrobium aurantiacum]
MYLKFKALLFFVALMIFTSSAFAQNNPCIVSTTYKIVVLGSSTAAGSGPSTSDSAWVNRYRSYLQNINPANEVVNLAVGGYNTYRIMPTGYVSPSNRPNPNPAKNITAALAENPDAIVVNMPSNDVASGFTYEEQMHNLDTIVQIANAAAVPIWICSTQPRNFNPVKAQLQWDLKDSILQQFAPNAIDFWTPFATPSYLVDPLYDSGDGIHLNDTAHGIMESRVIAADILQNIYISIPNSDPAILRILPINLSVCGDSLSQFEYELINFGPNDSLTVEIQSELTHQQTGTITTATETFVNGLAECSITNTTFDAPTLEAGDYSLSVIVSSTSNSNTSNDTLVYEFSTSGHPIWVAHDDTLCASDSTLLSVTADPQDTVLWYQDLTSPTPIEYGNTLQTPLITTTTDWYAEVVRGDLFYSDEIFTTNTSTTNFNGIMFDLVGHENITIDSFDVKINSTGPQTIELYKKNGSHIGSETNSNAWTLYESIDVNVLDPNVQTHVPFTALNIGIDDTVGIYLKMANSSARLSYRNSGTPQTRSTNELTINTGSGVNFGMTASYFPRDLNGRVYYHYGERLQGDCSSGRFPVTAHVNNVTFETIEDTIIDIQEALLITATPGMDSYEWMDGSTASTFNFVASQFGNGIHFVSVEALDSLGCSHEDTVIVGVAELAGLKGLSLEFTVFPNPTTGILNCSNSNIDRIDVISLEGKYLGQMKPVNGQVDLSPYKSGFYILKVNIGDKTGSVKVLKRD